MKRTLWTKNYLAYPITAIMCLYCAIAQTDTRDFGQFEPDDLDMTEIRSIVEERLVAKGISREEAREKLDRFSDEDILKLAKNPMLIQKTGFVFAAIAITLLIILLVLLIISIIEAEKAKAKALSKKKVKLKEVTPPVKPPQKRICSHCHGTGFTPNAVDRWGNRLPCSFCEGTGEYQEAPAETVAAPPQYTPFGVVTRTSSPLKNGGNQEKNLPTYTSSGVVAPNGRKIAVETLPVYASGGLTYAP